MSGPVLQRIDEPSSSSSGGGLDSQLNDHSKWQIIYPQYMSSKKTIPEGRRMPLKHCVEDPTVEEMAEICNFLKIATKIERGKLYPRDWMNSAMNEGGCGGRLRVFLKSQSGEHCHATIHTKAQLMRKMVPFFEKLKSRQERFARIAAAKARAEEQAAQETAASAKAIEPAPGGGGGGGAGGNKKKGKKKKK